MTDGPEERCAALERKLAERTRELAESLEQQAATAEILRVISSSPSDVQPVLDAIVKSALPLFGGMNVSLRLVRGDQFESVASTQALQDPRGEFPVPLRDGRTASSRAILERIPVQIPDILTAAEWVGEGLKRRAVERGWRALLVAPMLRESDAIGVIAVTRVAPGTFPDKQIALLQTFADQAVIAIENVRLFNETREALEQQTATAEILRVISSSPTDLQPVFDAILVNATRLCGAHLGGLGLYDGEKYEYVAQRGVKPEFLDRLFRGPFIPEEGTNLWHTITGKRPLHVPDLAHNEQVHSSSPVFLQLGARSLLSVPLAKEGCVVGTIVIYRTEVRPFTQEQIDLVSTFASQAVIAIENVRLFRELQARNAEISESLDQQTATSDILRVISSSPIDTQPVFDAMAESAARLCGAHDVVIRLIEGNVSSAVAHHGPIPIMAPIVLSRANISGRVMLDGRTAHIPDVTEAHVREEYPQTLTAAAGQRTFLGVPLMREGTAIGVILMRRLEVRPFTDKQIKLLETFAAQAVIAIENVRLFNEIQDKSRQLEVANRHKSEFLAGMSHELRTPLNAILGFSEVLAERMFGDINAKQAEYLDDIRSSGTHLLSLINDILDLSKIEAGRMDLELSPFDVAAALENALTLVRERATRHGISLDLQCAPGIGIWTADERKFKQIMLNLLSNAVKFTPSGGTITVRARASGQRLEIDVSDTGVGIRAEDQALVFEEFRQVGGDRVKKAEGTGLGLALTRKFIELHGGTIGVQSEIGKGATFSFTLPGKVPE